MEIPPAYRNEKAYCTSVFCFVPPKLFFLFRQRPRQIVPRFGVWHSPLGHFPAPVTLSLFFHFFSRSPVALPHALVYLAPH
jgi:hypothetical protein